MGIMLFPHDSLFHDILCLSTAGVLALAAAIWERRSEQIPGWTTIVPLGLGVSIGILDGAPAEHVGGFLACAIPAVVMAFVGKDTLSSGMLRLLIGLGMVLELKTMGVVWAVLIPLVVIVAMGMRRTSAKEGKRAGGEVLAGPLLLVSLLVASGVTLVWFR